MNATELALKRQLLQLEAAAQRDALARHAGGLQPLFHAADRIQAGARWIGRHPEAAVGGIAFVAAVRPEARRFLWRWGRRTFLAWRLWHDNRRWLSQPARGQGIGRRH